MKNKYISTKFTEFYYFSHHTEKNLVRVVENWKFLLPLYSELV